jgi:hypothetical protein
MSAEVIVTRLRLFLLWLAVALCGGVIAELWLTDHMEEPLQFVPFVVCGLSILALLQVLLRPQRSSLLQLRVMMVVAALGGLLGIYEHLAGNLAFAQEINVAKAAASPLFAALTGANPPLAPGALGVAALVGLAATYCHPKLTTTLGRKSVISHQSPTDSMRPNPDY